MSEVTIKGILCFICQTPIDTTTGIPAEVNANRDLIQGQKLSFFRLLNIQEVDVFLQFVQDERIQFCPTCSASNNLVGKIYTEYDKLVEELSQIKSTFCETLMVKSLVPDGDQSDPIRKIVLEKCSIFKESCSRPADDVINSTNKSDTIEDHSSIQINGDPEQDGMDDEDDDIEIICVQDSDGKIEKEIKGDRSKSKLDSKETLCSQPKRKKPKIDKNDKMDYDDISDNSDSEIVNVRVTKPSPTLPVPVVNKTLPECSKPFEFNDKTLDCLMSYMNVQELKKNRLVSKSWNTSALKQLKKLALTQIRSINFSDWRKIRKYNEVFIKSNRSESIIHKSFAFDLAQQENQKALVEEEVNIPIHAIKEFFRKVKPEKIEIYHHSDCPQSEKMLLDNYSLILHYCSLDVRELIVNIDAETPKYNKFQNLGLYRNRVFNKMTFPRLNSLAVCICSRNILSKVKLGAVIIKEHNEITYGIANQCPHLTKLKLFEVPKASLSGLVNKLAPKLKSLVFNRVIPGIENYLILLSKKGLQLETLKIHLKCEEISSIEERAVQNATFTNFLKSQSKTLKSLDLTLYSPYGVRKINMPPLEKLVNLSIILNKQKEFQDLNAYYPFEPMELSLFPSLRKLQLIGSLEKWIFDQFTGSSYTVENLTVKFISKSSTNLMNFRPIMELFPNTNFLELQIPYLFHECRLPKMGITKLILHLNYQQFGVFSFDSIYKFTDLKSFELHNNHKDHRLMCISMSPKFIPTASKELQLTSFAIKDYSISVDLWKQLMGIFPFMDYYPPEQI